MQQLGGGPRRDVRLDWQEVPEAASIAPRTLAIDLSGLAEGRFLLEVAVAAVLVWIMAGGRRRTL